jgi:lysophospholipase L1-like esterase
VSMSVTVAAAVLFLAGLGCAKCAAAEADVVWHEATELEIEGRGWTDTETPYDRLPARAKGSVPDSVWGLSKQSAGLCVRFQTNARTVSVQWDLNADSLAMPHMPATGVSGVDLYRREAGGTWRFVMNGRPAHRSGNTMTANLSADAAPTECLLYLPLYNGVSRLQIGVPAGADIGKAAPRLEAKRRPIAYYGTSIAQGGCASRPGMAHVAILGRMLDRPIINLGFSGSGRMEPAVSALLAELDPALYVIDCLWNMGDIPAPEFTSRVTTLVESIRKAHPHTPILFVGQSQINPGKRPSTLEALQSSIVQRLRGSGDAGLSAFAGRTLLGTDGEGTVDGVHPNDLGMMRQADALAPAIARLLR